MTGINKKQNDTFLWNAFRHGERGALELIYEEYGEILYRYGLWFVHDSDLLNDILQDFFLYLIEHRYSLGKTDHIGFYLIKSFRRFLLRRIHSSSQKNEFISQDAGFFTIVFSAEEMLIQHEKDRENRNTVRKALEKLTRQQREAIYLRFYQDLDYREIAEVMEIRYQSARTLVYLALKSLRKAFMGF